MAIENSGFSHEKWWIFPVRYVKLPEGTLMVNDLNYFTSNDTSNDPHHDMMVYDGEWWYMMVNDC